MRVTSFHSRVAALIIGVSVLLNGALWVMALKFFPDEEAAAILHYTTSAGIDFIGEGSRITVVPLTGLILLLLNTMLGVAVSRSDARSAWVLWSSIPICQLFLGAALYFIWRANA